MDPLAQDMDPEARAEFWRRLEQHHRERKFPGPLHEYTDWYLEAHEVSILDLAERCNEYGLKRHEMTNRVAKDRKQDDGPSEDIHIMGLKGEAAWTRYLGLPTDNLWKLSPGGAWLHDIWVGPQHAQRWIEVKTVMRPHASAHLSLYKNQSQFRSPCYALAMPCKHGEARSIDRMLVVGWASKARFQKTGAWKKLKTPRAGRPSGGRQWSLVAHELQAPSLLRQRVKEVLS